MADERKDESLAFEPSPYYQKSSGVSAKEYATNLREQSIRLSDQFGFAFFVVVVIFFGVLVATDNIESLVGDPGGIAGVVVASLALFAFSITRISAHRALAKGKDPPLYGDGGTRNDVLDIEDGDEAAEA